MRILEIAATLALIGAVGLVLAGLRRTAVLNGHLAEALKKRDLTAARALVKKGASPDTRGERSAPALVIAAHHGEYDLTRVLLERGANVDAVDQERWTPLLAAAARGHGDIAGLLLNCGADPGHSARDGTTPLKAAAVVGFLDVIDLLKSRGAETGMRPKATLARDAVLLTLKTVAGQRFFDLPTTITVRRVRPGCDGFVSVALSRPHLEVVERGAGRPQQEFFKETFSGAGSYLEGYFRGLGDGPEDQRVRGADQFCAAARSGCEALFKEGKLGNQFEVRAEHEREVYRVRVLRVPYQPSARWCVHLTHAMRVRRVSSP